MVLIKKVPPHGGIFCAPTLSIINIAASFSVDTIIVENQVSAANILIFATVNQYFTSSEAALFNDFSIGSNRGMLTLT
jgi:hypothetical protein